MRVAIYGGSFNPPHLSHQLAITCVLSTARVDEVWMVPTFKHPFDKQLAPYEDRVRMCELAAAPFHNVRVSRVEEELGGESYTLRTVKALMARHPGDELFLVIGADLVAERERWHGWPELQQLAKFIVVGRQGAPAPGGPAPGEVALPAISSTVVRQKVARGEAIDALVPAGVVDYIATRGLYT